MLPPAGAWYSAPAAVMQSRQLSVNLLLGVHDGIGPGPGTDLRHDNTRLQINTAAQTVGRLADRLLREMCATRKAGGAVGDGHAMRGRVALSLSHHGGSDDGLAGDRVALEVKSGDNDDPQPVGGGGGKTV